MIFRQLAVPSNNKEKEVKPQNRFVFSDSFENACRFLLDKLGSVLLLVLTTPILIATSICIYLEDGRPIFFRQWRAGKDGKPFKIFKFRSMKKGADKDPRSLFVDEKNPFLTRVGRFIRKWSVDELPQLFNVLMGQMSLVGPRPTLLYQVKKYDAFQKKRLLVKPGLTGWAQIHNWVESSWEERIKLDIWYIEHRSLFLDLYILFRTIPVVMGEKRKLTFKVDEIAKPEGNIIS